MLLPLMIFWICHLHTIKGQSFYKFNNWFSSSKWWRSEDDISIRAGSYSYTDPNGTASWIDEYPDCGGREQSPIDLETDIFLRRKTKASLSFKNYDKTPISMTVENSQHSLYLRGVWEEGDTPYITKGPLSKRYYFTQLHFHWSNDSRPGSEHAVNGERFVAEMHVVHSSFTNKTKKGYIRSGIVVIGYMLEITANDNPGLTKLLEGKSAMEVKGNQKREANIPPFRLSCLVDLFKRDYVVYSGSLTTPPCTEGVLWIINSRTMDISQKQLDLLKSYVTDADNNTISNYRDLQPLNGRKIYYVYW